MTPGRKPKPVEQKRREGNPGKRKLPAPTRQELERRSGARAHLAVPAGLPPAGAEIWQELVVRLEDAGIIDQVDRPALTAMCLQWARAAEARKVLAEDGIFGLGSMGQVIEHPALAIERAAHSLFLRFAEQYGATPAARARIAAVMTTATVGQELLHDIITAEPELRR